MILRRRDLFHGTGLGVFTTLALVACQLGPQVQTLGKPAASPSASNGGTSTTPTPAPAAQPANGAEPTGKVTMLTWAELPILTIRQKAMAPMKNKYPKIDFQLVSAPAAMEGATGRNSKR